MAAIPIPASSRWPTWPRRGADQHRVQAAPLPAHQRRTRADAQPDPGPRVALRLRRRCQRARDVCQLPAPQGRPARPPAHSNRARRRVRLTNATKMTLSLRGRLLIGVMSLVVLGILVFDFATYATMQSFLLSRVDSQLTLGRAVAVRAL